MRLTLEVVGTVPGVRNTWPVWVCPAEDRGPHFPEVRTCRGTTPECRADLAAGRTVLLLPPAGAVKKALPARFIPVFWSPLHFPNQPGTLGATIDAEHPLWERSPTDTHTNGYEVNTSSTAADDPASHPGMDDGRNAIGINFNTTGGENPNVTLSPLAFAGVPGFVQKNWNRTIDFTNTASALTGGIADIDTPNFQEIVDSAGNVIGDSGSGVTLSFTSGGSAYASNNEGATPYGRLFSGFIYGLVADSSSTVNLGSIPYAQYDAYVYIGSDSNNRQGTVTSSSAGGATHSFTTGSNALFASGFGANYVETTDTGAGFPKANYVVFRNQTSGAFDVTTSWTTPGGGNLGIFGVQIVESAAASGLVLENSAWTGGVFTADFTTTTAGTFVLERSAALDDDWSAVGVPFIVGAGTSQVSDSGASGPAWFYRVREQ